MRQTLTRGIAALVLLLTLAGPGWAQPSPTPPPVPRIPELPGLPELPDLEEAPNPELPEAPAPEIPSAPSAEEIPAAPGAEDAPELVEADYGNNIRIEGTPDFVKQSVALLDRLAALPTGKEILRQLGETGKDTVIRATEDDNAYAAPLDFADLDDASYDAEGKAGAGTDAQVMWNPEFQLEGFTPEIIMGHELIHALHVHRGELNLTRQTEGPNAGTRLEELRTIGTDGFEDEAISENALRREWNAAHPDRRVPMVRTGHGPADFAPEPGEGEAKGPTAQAPGDQPPGGGSLHQGHTTQSPCAGCSHKGLSDILKQHFGGQK